MMKFPRNKIDPPKILWFFRKPGYLFVTEIVEILKRFAIVKLDIDSGFAIIKVTIDLTPKLRIEAKDTVPTKSYKSPLLSGVLLYIGEAASFGVQLHFLYFGGKDHGNKSGRHQHYH